ncbi:MAG: cell division protein ZipA C-terminal FtsZ-binding domain-containing protein [Methylosarcina sp.]
MDKELLRIVIIATGLLVIVGMLVWAFVKGRRSRHDTYFYGDDVIGKIDESLIVQNDHDDFDIIPLGPAKQPAASQETAERYALHDEPDEWEADDLEVESEEDEPPPRFIAPQIIQFSIVAKAEEGFNGLDLVNAFQLAGLEYGNLKIFERLDANRLVDFGVASMVPPGTFPEDNLESFYCPGIVFFMQPSELEDAAGVFEDYLDTIELVAAELDGAILDHQRQPLTDNMVRLIRQSL